MKMITFFLTLAAAVLLGITYSSSNALAAASDEPLVQQGDLVYQGAFRVPQGNSGSDSNPETFNYGGTALGFNPNGNGGQGSLYLVGHDWTQLTAEISIPQIINSANINSLSTASMLQSFADVTEGRLSSINPGDPNSKKIGGNLIYGEKLIQSGYSYYDGSGSQSTSHFVSGLTLSANGDLQGPYKVGDLNPGFVSGYMTNIPSEWQSVLGGPSITGNCCLSVISRTSSGPAAFVFNPSTLGQGSTPAQPLVYYPLSNPLAQGDTQNNLYNLSTYIKGVVFPAGTRSVLFFGRIGLGPYCYGEGSACNDPVDSSKGTHMYPYRYQVWAYDANDLARVKNASTQPYAVRPYSVWNFDLPFAQGKMVVGGADYDPKTKRIFVTQECTDGECYPIIHVFKVNVGTTPPADTTPPSTPSTLRIR